MEEKKTDISFWTVWDALGTGSFNAPDEARLVQVGEYRLFIIREKHLDRYGNPVHAASLANKDGTCGRWYRSNGGADNTVILCLEENGIIVKYHKR